MESIHLSLNIKYMTTENKIKIVQAHMCEYAEDAPILNSDEELASKVFVGAVRYATTVFINRLALGGQYHGTKNIEEIAECLRTLHSLIEQ